MKRTEIDELKEKVGCEAVLVTAGFKLDVKESTRRALKYRRGADIVIVTHEGKGWFDPLSDGKGDVFSLIANLDKVGFVDASERIAALIGFQATSPVWRKDPKRPNVACAPLQRWAARSKPWPGSSTWRYLCAERFLPPAIVRAAIGADLLREGPCGSMWAAHNDEQAVVAGWEERGPEWRGFAKGGSKSLFRFGPAAARRLCVTEAAIDAMSLASVDGLRDGTLYLSTGGGWSPLTEAALQALAGRTGSLIVAATDANTQGETFAERLRALADRVGCAWQRLRPPADDWNEVLKEKRGRKREG